MEFELLFWLNSHIVETHVGSVLEQSHFGGMGAAFASYQNDSFELDIPRKRYVEY